MARSLSRDLHHSDSPPNAMSSSRLPSQGSCLCVQGTPVLLSSVVT